MWHVITTNQLHHHYIIIASLQTLGGVAAGSVSPWPMAHLDISQLKAFNARRKWHVSVCVCGEGVLKILSYRYTPTFTHTLTHAHTHTHTLTHTHTQTAAVAADSTVVFGPRSALCPSPLPPDFEELGRNECKSPSHIAVSLIPIPSPLQVPFPYSTPLSIASFLHYHPSYHSEQQVSHIPMIIRW